MIVVDATALSLLFNPDAKPPLDPSTGKPVARSKARLEYLVREIERQRETIVIPSPVLAEALVMIGDGGPAFLDLVARSDRFKVAPFDTRGAVELAAMSRDAIRAGDKTSGSTAPWQKVKFDRQIIAIARVQGAQRIYSDDVNLGKFAANVGISVVRTWELPLPPEDPQLEFFQDDEAD